jgi:multimeric flavodoxin WrbA
MKNRRQSALEVRADTDRRDFIKKTLLATGGILAGAAGMGAASELFDANNKKRKLKVVAVNSSPRKNGNTAALCNHFLDGALAVDGNVETSLFNLYDVEYKGCISCFACKRANSPSYGKCVRNDGITEIIEKVLQADAVAFASPIYFGDVNGQMKCFLERLLFPCQSYEKDFRTMAPKRMPTVMIYTMNDTEEGMRMRWNDKRWEHMEGFIERIFMPPQRICAFNTWQFKDYSAYKADGFSEAEKSEQRKKQFPADCQNAFNAGKNTVQFYRS